MLGVWDAVERVSGSREKREGTFAGGESEWWAEHYATMRSFPEGPHLITVKAVDPAVARPAVSRADRPGRGQSVLPVKNPDHQDSSQATF